MKNIMSWGKLFGVALLLIYAQLSVAASFVNTIGSKDGVAISGFDTVAFFTEKKALQGKSEYSVEWMGAKWLFSSQENMELFKANSEKYVPQYGGHCSWGISENGISRKPFAGAFEIMQGKLYLFAPGNSSPDGARTSWWQTGGGPNTRIEYGNNYWPALRTKLEARRSPRR